MSGLPDIGILGAQVGYSRLEWRVSNQRAARLWPPHPSRRRHSASKTRVNALMAPPQDEGGEGSRCSP